MISILDLSSGYGHFPVLRGVGFTAQAGELTVLIGPNGSGKSTLLKTMARLLPAREGKILLCGEDIRAFSRKALARKIAYLPQNRDVPALCVYALALHGRYPYLGFPRKPGRADHEAVLSALEQTGMLALKDRPLASLSGGERQRAYLAMLLSQEAQTILLDEPTAHLDISARLQFLELIKRLRKAGKTLVVVLHELDDALSIADQIILLDGGKLRFGGTPDALLKTRALREAFFVEPHVYMDERARPRYYFTPARE